MTNLPEHIIQNIPKQTNGKSYDCHLVIESEMDIKPTFEIIKKRLLNINKWSEYASLSGADFLLIDKDMKCSITDAKIGDYIKIRYSKHQNLLSEKHDFVQIENIICKSNLKEPYFILQIRPSKDPTSDSEEISHFFNKQATNSFALFVENSKLHFSIMGRNECSNKEVASTIDKLRHVLFAHLGYIVISKIQWESFANGITNINGGVNDK